MEMVGGVQAIKATVPLSNMFGYARTLALLSGGRASSVMRFLHYEEAPNRRNFDDDEPFTGIAVPKRPRPGGGRSAAEPR
jgi:translation elongation factor EF-G